LLPMKGPNKLECLLAFINLYLWLRLERSTQKLTWPTRVRRKHSYKICPRCQRCFI
jgi:hypothetical protein